MANTSMSRCLPPLDLHLVHLLFGLTDKRNLKVSLVETFHDAAFPGLLRAFHVEKKTGGDKKTSSSPLND